MSHLGHWQLLDDLSESMYIFENLTQLNHHMIGGWFFAIYVKSTECHTNKSTTTHIPLNNDINNFTASDKQLNTEQSPSQDKSEKTITNDAICNKMISNENIDQTQPLESQNNPQSKRPYHFERNSKNSNQKTDIENESKTKKGILMTENIGETKDKMLRLKLSGKTDLLKTEKIRGIQEHMLKLKLSGTIDLLKTKKIREIKKNMQKLKLTGKTDLLKTKKIKEIKEDMPNMQTVIHHQK